MIDIISFTEKGEALSLKIREGFKEEVRLYSKRRTEGGRDRGLLYVPEPLTEWTKERFADKRAMVFIGAAGIAVRSIAPHVSDKTKDPAVIVVDEAGKFVIPLLSAHLGGGGELAITLAKVIDATPVITTATDVNGLFAIDCFARKNTLVIKNREDMKKVSAALLSGRRLSIWSGDGELAGCLPEGLEEAKEESRADIVISVYEASKEGRELIRLYPKAVHLGIGCRAGKTAGEIGEAVKHALDGAGISPLSLSAVASVDLKAEEEGLKHFAEENGLEFKTFSAGELKEVRGAFSASSFVEEVTGVDNVCERSAYLSASLSSVGRAEPVLILEKTVGNGITVAAACEAWEVVF